MFVVLSAYSTLLGVLMLLGLVPNNRNEVGNLAFLAAAAALLGVVYYKQRASAGLIEQALPVLPKESLYTVIVCLYDEDAALRQSAGRRVCELAPEITREVYETWSEEHRFLFRKLLHDSNSEDDPVPLDSDVKQAVAEMLLRVGSNEDQRVARENLRHGVERAVGR